MCFYYDKNLFHVILMLHCIVFIKIIVFICSSSFFPHRHYIKQCTMFFCFYTWKPLYIWQMLHLIHFICDKVISTPLTASGKSHWLVKSSRSEVEHTRLWSVSHWVDHKSLVRTALQFDNTKACNFLLKKKKMLLTLMLCSGHFDPERILFFLKPLVMVIALD